MATMPLYDFFLRWLSGMHLEHDLRYLNPNFRDLLQIRCPNEPGVPEVPVRYGESAIYIYICAAPFYTRNCLLLVLLVLLRPLGAGWPVDAAR